ncbi:MAG: DUF4168 domain-containing protein [Synechococcaceae cyanobacterium SM2_3_1]|nr:DUF4168 domain-containing protein [Synechococcaceae cyanobacterium SM2_3_1]
MSTAKHLIQLVATGVLTATLGFWPTILQAQPEDQPTPEDPTPETTSSPPPLASPPPAQAPSLPQAQPPALQAEDVTDEQVDQLVAALIAIEPLVKKASADLNQAETDQQRLQIEQQFERQATGIVEDNGLTVDQYRQLVNLANSEPAFGQRVAAALEDLQQEPGSESGAAGPPETEADPAAAETDAEAETPGTAIE